MTSRTCSIPGCARKAPYAGPLCPMHHRRRLRTGDVGGPGVSSARPRQKFTSIASTGYVRVWAPGHPMAMADGWAFEHRKVTFDAGLIAAGDDLHVHHINHDRTDNRLENLEVLTPEEHRSRHRKERKPRKSRARPQHEHKTPEYSGWVEPQTCADLYLSGLTTIQVGVAVGLDSSTVSRKLKEAGVTTRRTVSQLGLDEEAIVLRLRSGERLDAIARSLGVSRMPIERIRKSAGIPPPRPGRPPAGVMSTGDPEANDG